MKDRGGEKKEGKERETINKASPRNARRRREMGREEGGVGII